MARRFKNSQVLAHRGFWYPDLGKNSVEAFHKASSFGFGIETDLRNDSRGVWVAHDAIELNEMTEASQTLYLEVPIALNIKSDGLSAFGIDHLPKILSTGSFFFDGSIPQMLDFRRNNIPHALRMSEYELSLPWIPEYIWLDSFESDWWLSELNIFEIYPGSNFVIVSPELHNRVPDSMWNAIYQLDSSFRDRVMVCTDRPMDFIEWDE